MEREENAPLPVRINSGHRLKMTPGGVRRLEDCISLIQAYLATLVKSLNEKIAKHELSIAKL